MVKYTINANNIKTNILEKTKTLLLFIPILTLYLPIIAYPYNGNIENNPSFKPPEYVFIIIWPILLLLLVINWKMRKKMSYFTNIMCALLIIFLGMWFIIYYTNHCYRLFDFYFCVGIFLFFYFIRKFNKYLYLSLLPLISWLIFICIIKLT